MIRRSIQISGLVQGVWFRKYTHEKALQLQLKGFVKNLPDGTVYAEAEGSEQDVQLFIEWCHQGSPLSKVENVRVEEMNTKGENSFEILR